MTDNNKSINPDDYHHEDVINKSELNNKRIRAKTSESTLYLKVFELIKMTNIYFNHGPKHEKYGLCLRIRNAQYDLLELVVECQKRYHKKTTLTQLDIIHEKLRLMHRVYYELGYLRYKTKRISDEGYSLEIRRNRVLNDLIDEIGALIGGWIKSERSKTKK